MFEGLKNLDMRRRAGRAGFVAGLTWASLWLTPLHAQHVSARGAVVPGCVRDTPMSELVAQGEAGSACVIGRMHLEFESDRLTQGPLRVWLDVFDAPYSSASAKRDTRRHARWKSHLQDRCVRVQGHCNPLNTGHLGMHPDGGIERIQFIKAVSESLCPPNDLPLPRP